MSVLDPYIKSGKLKVLSGQTGMDKVSTLRWDGAGAGHDEEVNSKTQIRIASGIVCVRPW